jgi:Collagen triple helix repeat (20 copies)
MLSRIRRRLCYANVVATLALVFAMSGGALAANRYLLTSTSQVSPKVLKALKGKSGQPGPAGGQGLAGPQGLAGAQGPKGEPGAAGATGTAGATGATGAQGPRGAQGAAGVEGSPWTAGGTLPSGKTETGVWAFTYPESLFTAIAPIASFSIPLAEPPTFNSIGTEEGEGEPKAKLPAGCKGNATKPEADPGNLCVFETFGVNVRGLSTENNNKVSTTGAVALVSVDEYEKEFHAYGTWAVTAK